MRSLLWIFAGFALAGCAPDWFSAQSNPTACPVNAPPQGMCAAEGTGCIYSENTGNSERPARWMTCSCTAQAWVCTTANGLITDAGPQDAATE